MFTTRLYLTNESHKPVFCFFPVAVVCCTTNDIWNSTVQLLHVRANCNLHSLLLLFRDLSVGYLRIIIVVQFTVDHPLKKCTLCRCRGSNGLNVSLEVKEVRDWRHKDMCATVSLINQIKFSHWLRQFICCQKLPYSYFHNCSKASGTLLLNVAVMLIKFFIEHIEVLPIIIIIIIIIIIHSNRVRCCKTELYIFYIWVNALTLLPNRHHNARSWNLYCKLS